MPTLQKEPKANEAAEACATLNSMHKSISKIPNMQRLKAVARCPTEASTSGLLAQERDGPQTPNMQSHRGGWAGSERGANRLESSSSSRSYRQERRGQDQVTSISPPSNPLLLPYSVQVSSLFIWIRANTSSSLIFLPQVLPLPIPLSQQPYLSF